MLEEPLVAEGYHWRRNKVQCEPPGHHCRSPLRMDHLFGAFRYFRPKNCPMRSVAIKQAKIMTPLRACEESQSMPICWRAAVTTKLSLNSFWCAKVHVMPFIAYAFGEMKKIHFRGVGVSFSVTTRPLKSMNNETSGDANTWAWRVSLATAPTNANMES